MGADAAVKDPLEESAEIRRLTERHDSTNVRGFGSFARAEAGPESNLDLLIALAPDRSLLDLIVVEQELEDLLDRTVDVHRTVV